MNFVKLRERLTADLRERVRRGEITERGLARLTGVSQPHVHNVLNGKRLLSPEMADRLMAGLRIDLLDLVEPGELLHWRSHH
jgi:transcriptional regulator with XRE-family HTH domain